MKKSIYLLLAFSILFTSCFGQNTYFKPTGIIDKTEEYVLDHKSWTLLKDKERVDGYTRIGDSIFGGEIACNIEPLKGIDVKTFRVLAGTQYAKDTNHVYYPLTIPCIDYRDCGVCFYAEIIIKGADPESFEYLGKDYAKDEENAYFRGKLIPKADGKTFKVIEGPEFFYFAVDKNYVYKHENIFENGDPETFYYDKDDPRNSVRKFDNKYIIGDKNSEWQYTPPHKIKKIRKK